MPRRILKINLVLLILACAVVSSIGSAKAHGWYPQECCHDRDCAVVISFEYSKGRLPTVTTPRGTVEIPPGFPIRLSQDNDAHACFEYGEYDEPFGGWRLLCLFLPANASSPSFLIGSLPTHPQIAAISRRERRAVGR
jgi:hypothetical protein